MFDRFLNISLKSTKKTPNPVKTLDKYPECVSLVSLLLTLSIISTLIDRLWKYLFKVNIKDIKTMFMYPGIVNVDLQQVFDHVVVFLVPSRNRTVCKICLTLTTKTAERRDWSRWGVCTVNFKHISYIALAFPLFTLNTNAYCVVANKHVSVSQEPKTCSCNLTWILLWS